MKGRTFDFINSIMKFRDQLNRELELRSFPPKRIISIVPSQTELLFDLGLDEEVIGITKFCVHPEKWCRTKKRIGGTKQLNIPLIRELQPDLIIANKEENEKEQVKELEKEFPVWISDVKKLEEAYDMIERVGELVDRPSQSRDLIVCIRANFNRQNSTLESPQTSNLEYRTAYLIWKDPYMTVGGDTFISEMMKFCGLKNIFELQSRYPEVSIHHLSSIHCQLLLLSSEPYPFQQKHVDELNQVLPGTKIMLVDGEMFSWYGSRLQHAPSYFAQLQKLVFNR